MIPPNSHSAHVSLEFRNATNRIPLAQLAIDFAIASMPIELEPCKGEILMAVDGVETRIPLDLPDGIRADLQRFAIKPLSASPS